MILNKFFKISILSIFCVAQLSAAEPDKHLDLLKKGIKLNLSEDGKSYTKFSFATQFWGRQTWLNHPEETVAGSYNSEFDFALRRTRFSMVNNLNDKLVFYTQLGCNNIHKASDKPQLYLHDVWAMFQLVPKSMYLGFGLNGWNGISRLSNTSYQKTLTLDNPGFNIPTVNHSDLETRQLGFFLKGTTGAFSYRAALSKPFDYDRVPDSPEENTAYEISSDKLSCKAYVAWHLWEKEYFTTPYVSMTYLGKKKILNVGLGFDYYPESVLSYTPEETAQIDNRMLLGVDVFCELPFAQNQSITFYSVLYHYDFGNNYLRSSGTMNIWENGGNSEYKVGTGLISYSTLGYLFKEEFMHLPGRLQLFYAYSFKDFEGLPVHLENQDMGVNYYMAGQKLKFGLQYSSRPVLNATETDIEKHCGTLIFQTQIVI
nr:hypothetical protein [uncultured Draconibacterium sp.]